MSALRLPRPGMSRISAGLLPLSISAALLAGCSSSGGEPQLDPARGCDETSSVSAAGTSTIELPPAHVQLLEPGTGPLQTAEPAPRTDAPTAVSLTTRSQETSVVGAEAQAPTTTVEEVSSALTVRAVCTEPTHAEFAFTSVTSPDEALSLGAFDDATGGLTYGPGLAASALRLRPPETADAPARRAVEQSLVSALSYSVPLPTELIGTGARWRVQRQISAATSVTQVMEATLTSREGSVLTVDVTVDETPDSPVFRIPGSSSVLDMTRYRNTGTGTLTLDLASYFPTEGKLELAGARELVGADAERPILQQTGFTLTWSAP